MVFVILGFVGVLGVAAIIFGFDAEGARSVGLTALGVVMAAGSLIGFGAETMKRRSRPSYTLEDDKARDELAERQAARAAEVAKERSKQEREERRQAQLRDLDRIRRAILAELDKLGDNASLIFSWGNRDGDRESREYGFVQGEFRPRFQHRNQGSLWTWPDGGMPSPRESPWDPRKPEDVDRAYQLLQPERYLVGKNLPSESLELPDPGYFGSGRV